MFSSCFLSHRKDSISAPFQSNTLRSYTQRRNLYLEEQRKVGVHAFRNHISWNSRLRSWWNIVINYCVCVCVCQPSHFEWFLSSFLFQSKVCCNCDITSSLHPHERLNAVWDSLGPSLSCGRSWQAFCLFLSQGGCLRKHSSHHFGDEQWGDAVWHWQQRQWLTELRHVLWQLRSAVPQAHGFTGRVQPPLVGPQRHAQSCQLPAKKALIQAEAQNPQLGGC